MKQINTKMLTILGLAGIFLLSGFAGLIYESIWTHYLKLFIGHAAYAQTLVLIIYMGGMAGGSWLASIFSKRLKNLLFYYAITEALIGITALFFHGIFVQYLDYSYKVVLPALNSTFLTSLYKWSTASLLILPQSILLGATFPLMSGGVLRRIRENPGYTISVLYFINSLGAAIGVLFSGFYLIEYAGLPGTIRWAGTIDIIVALLTLFFCFRKDVPEINTKDTRKNPMHANPALPVKTLSVLYLSCFLTAAASFIYEIGWVRMLSLVLGSSTHAFELMLSAFIFGLAIGGFWIRKKVDRFKEPMIVFTIIQIVMGILAISTLFIYSNLFYFMRDIILALGKTFEGYFLFNVFSHLLCLIIMLPATVCAGMTLPILTHYLYKQTADDSVIGKVYSFNTFGSIFGVITATHLLMPYTGLKGLLIIGGALDMGVGLLIIWYFYLNQQYFTRLALSIISIVIVLFSILVVKLDPLLLSSGVYRSGVIDLERKTMYYKDGKTSTVSIHSLQSSCHLSNNGKPDASISTDTNMITVDEQTQILLAAYPLAFAKNVSNIGMIGLGSGMTGAVILADDSVKALDIIEIEPFVKEAAQLMGPKVSRVFNDNRANIIIDDAKAYFSGHRKKYDIIISEPSNPWVSGVAGLFSKEFFHLIQNYLTDDGIMVQWFHLYEMAPTIAASIFKALDSEFYDYRVYFVASDLIILASKKEIPATPVHDIFKQSKLARDLKMLGIENSTELALNMMGSKSSLKKLFDSYDIIPNSDYYPVLDNKAVLSRYLGTRADQFMEIGDYVLPIIKTLENDTHYTEIQPYGRDLRPLFSVKRIASLYRAKQALFYINALGTDREPFADSVVARSTSIYVAKIRMAANDNSASAHAQVPRYILDLLEITLPYLTAEEMKPVWDFVEKYMDKGNIKKESRELFTFMRLFNECRFADAIELGKKILGKGDIDPSPSMRIALNGTLCAMVKQNDFAGINEIKRKIRFDYSSDLNLRLLLQF